MQKSLAYALMLAATLGLAACDKPSEDKAEEAREAQSEAQDSMNEAAEHSNEATQKAGEAAEERAKENAEEVPTAPVTPPPPANQQQ
ncbi:hypothetical protein [Aquipseudomonas ullengensis]|uniref:Lipoprotein n=1 Tax=Aquipseudomonas ullengensis TaxID=2759166 RepID=A0A7W4QB98_9GAMM|nr:hypothetical protein [Pseudomonas ullengensis]MBB2496275.1 hypothetical protein [Pseudomonas ullengensis]